MVSETCGRKNVRRTKPRLGNALGSLNHDFDSVGPTFCRRDAGRLSTATYRHRRSTALPLWLSVDDTEHASGVMRGQQNTRARAHVLPGSLQRCQVVVDKFAAFDTGVLDHLTPFFSHFGTKDLKTENRTGPTGTSCRLRRGNGCRLFSRVLSEPVAAPPRAFR